MSCDACSFPYSLCQCPEVLAARAPIEPQRCIDLGPRPMHVLVAKSDWTVKTEKRGPGTLL